MCIVQHLYRHNYFATCPPLLEFLGIEPLADRKYYIAREKYLEGRKREQKEKDTEEDTTDLFDTDAQHNDETKLSPSPLPATSGKLTITQLSVLCLVYSTESLFHGSDRKTTAAFKMPDDSTDALFALNDATEQPDTPDRISVEDNSELLR